MLEIGITASLRKDQPRGPQVAGIDLAGEALVIAGALFDGNPAPEPEVQQIPDRELTAPVLDRNHNAIYIMLSNQFLQVVGHPDDFGIDQAFADQMRLVIHEAYHLEAGAAPLERCPRHLDGLLS